MASYRVRLKMRGVLWWDDGLGTGECANPICLLPVMDAASRRVLIWAVRAGNISPRLLDPVGNKGILVPSNCLLTSFPDLVP